MKMCDELTYYVGKMQTDALLLNIWQFNCTKHLWNDWFDVKGHI